MTSNARHTKNTKKKIPLRTSLSTVPIVHDRVLGRRNIPQSDYEVQRNDEATPLISGCLPKWRFRAGLGGGMIATGVPSPVHGGILRG